MKEIIKVFLVLIGIALFFYFLVRPGLQWGVWDNPKTLTALKGGEKMEWEALAREGVFYVGLILFFLYYHHKREE